MATRTVVKALWLATMCGACAASGQCCNGASSPPVSGDDPCRNDNQLMTVEIAGTPQRVHYTQRGISRFFQGDIQLRPSGGPARGDVVAVGNIWPGARIAYRIDASITSDTSAGGMRRSKYVTDAIAHWQTQTPIQFVSLTNETAFVTFTDGDGCDSEVGRQGREQTIHLKASSASSDTECSLGGVIHEIGHTVGLFHEQSRPNRDDHVKVLWSNIDTELDKFNFCIELSTPVGAYDLHSIMHYASTAFGITQCGTVQKTLVQLDGSDIPWNGTHLSEGDKCAVLYLYDKKMYATKCPAAPKDCNCTCDDGRKLPGVENAEACDNACWHSSGYKSHGHCGAICGALGEACCTSASLQCQGTLVCQGGLCKEPPPCGAAGQKCCSSGTACQTGLVCAAGGLCQAPPPPCGGPGQACCPPNAGCNAELTCQKNKCEPPTTCNCVCDNGTTGGVVASQAACDSVCWHSSGYRSHGHCE